MSAYYGRIVFIRKKDKEIEIVSALKIKLFILLLNRISR